MIAQESCSDMFYPNSLPCTGQNILKIDCFGIPNGTQAQVDPSTDDIKAINTAAADCWPNYWYVQLLIILH